MFRVVNNMSRAVAPVVQRMATGLIRGRMVRPVTQASSTSLYLMIAAAGVATGVGAFMNSRVNPEKLKLADVKAVNGNEIRPLLKGNKEVCLRLFREAVQADDSVLQMQLAYAFLGMKWEIEHDDYCLTFGIFEIVYEEAMQVKSHWITWEERGLKTFAQAAEKGYLPAVLALKRSQWSNLHFANYGLAADLRPFVGKGCKILDYYFGVALKNGCEIGSKGYYEGLYWMEHSLGIPVGFPEKDQSFDEFWKQYIIDKDCFSTYFSHDSFYHVGNSVVLAPSKEAWDRFLNEKLKSVKIAEPGASKICLNRQVFE